MRRLLARWFLLFMLVAVTPPGGGTRVFAADDLLGENSIAASPPDTAQAARLLNAQSPLRLVREDGFVPGWAVMAATGPVGYIASTYETARSVGYSGRPIDVLVAIAPGGKIAGAELVRHNESILTLGISTSDIARYVDAFSGVDLTVVHSTDFGARSDLPDIVSRATVSTGVIRDAILRTARMIALQRGFVGGKGAALAIPAKLKPFDSLRRRSQRGRECRLCEHKCTVGAIDPIGRINPNECLVCLRFQMIYHDPKSCTILKRRAARTSRSVPPSPTPPESPV